MKLTTPAHAAPGVWSVGMIRSQIASSVLPSFAVRKRHGELWRPQDASPPHAVAVQAMRRNPRRRSEGVLKWSKTDHSALPFRFPPPVIVWHNLRWGRRGALPGPPPPHHALALHTLLSCAQ